MRGVASGGVRHGGRVFLALVVSLLAVAGPTSAHPAPFSFLDVRIEAGRIGGSLTIHDLDAAHELGLADARTLLDPAVLQRHAPALAALLASRLHLLVNGQAVAATFSNLTPLPDRQALRFDLAIPAPPGTPAAVTADAALFPYDPQHQTFVNVYEDGALRHQAILDVRRTATTYYAGTWQGVAAVLATFVPSGIHHIVIGPDHVLFLVGLLLLGGSARRLGLIVTAFTLGHSVTLSLAALNLVTPPGWLVEPAIALSIVLVGADNLLVGREADAAAARRDLRPAMAGAFGLIHGFGFAAVLAEFGLPAGALGWSLLGFNLGVELGQIALVLPLAVVLGLVRRQRPELGRRIAPIGSGVVVLAGAYWFVQRVFFPEGS
jgi:hydrogenase/urease accessory protein HupE